MGCVYVYGFLGLVDIVVVWENGDTESMRLV